MLELESTVLLGFHNPLTSSGISLICEVLGYKADSVSSVEEMLARIGQREYQGYIMDLNLGNRNSPNIEPAIRVYEALKEQIESKRAKFLGVATNLQALAAARERDILSMDKSDLDTQTLSKFLKGE